MRSDKAKQAEFLSAETYKFQYLQKTCRKTSNLDLLCYGTFAIVPDAVSDELYHHKEEVILFCIKGRLKIVVEKQGFELSNYDTLYIPLATPYIIENISSEQALLVVCKAGQRTNINPFTLHGNSSRRTKVELGTLGAKMST